MRSLPPLGPGCAALNPHIAGPFGQAASSNPPTTAPARRPTATARAERDLQANVEQWLVHRGYRRLTADEAQRGPPDRGYFGHLHKPQGNPLMLDLWILAPAGGPDRHGGRYLQVELKAGPTAPFQDGQRELIAQGYGHLATGFDEAVEIVTAWERETQTQAQTAAAGGTGGPAGPRQAHHLSPAAGPATTQSKAQESRNAPCH